MGKLTNKDLARLVKKIKGTIKDLGENDGAMLSGKIDGYDIQVIIAKT